MQHIFAKYDSKRANKMPRKHRLPPPPPPPPRHARTAPPPANNDNNTSVGNLTTTTTAVASNQHIPPAVNGVASRDHRSGRPTAALDASPPAVIPMTSFSPIRVDSRGSGSGSGSSRTPLHSVARTQAVVVAPVASVASSVGAATKNATRSLSSDTDTDTASSTTNLSAGGGSDGEFNCAICMQDVPHYTHLVMPCCGNVNASAKFCAPCIHKVAETGVQGRFGKCPLCPMYFTLRAGLVALQRTIPKPCRICRIESEVADAQRGICALCVVGTQHRFNYECSRCSNVQVIPHPMWMYQPGAGEFGEADWLCNDPNCREFAHWRICFYDLKHIPDTYAPEAWGKRKKWMSDVLNVQRRERVQQSRRSSASGLTNVLDDEVRRVRPDVCVIN